MSLHVRVSLHALSVCVCVLSVRHPGCAKGWRFELAMAVEAMIYSVMYCDCRKKMEKARERERRRRIKSIYSRGERQRDLTSALTPQRCTEVLKEFDQQESVPWKASGPAGVPHPTVQLTCNFCFFSIRDSAFKRKQNKKTWENTEKTSKNLKKNLKIREFWMDFFSWKLFLLKELRELWGSPTGQVLAPISAIFLTQTCCTSD